jgi:hypothetical protein
MRYYIRKGSQGKLELNTLTKIPVRDNTSTGMEVIVLFIVIYCIYYFLLELHDLHKTIILSNVFKPPFAKLNI